MTEIIHLLALRLRTLFRRALDLISPGAGPEICFATGPDDIRGSVRSADRAVEYHGGGELPPIGYGCRLGFFPTPRAAREASTTHRKPRNRLKGIKAGEIDLEAALEGETR